ncbi:MAG: pitrilysin family protein [Crocinitomicaceae bacterium]|nr:pitrilysin family protein [Crocinitomicaceae bacterium]
MKKIILSCALILSASLGYSQLDRSVRPKAATPPTINIKDSEVFKTNNGITVILSENHKLPKVSIQLVMGADPIAEGSRAGLSDITGQLIMSGTSNRSKDKLDNEIDYIGATLSATGSSIYLSCLSKHAPKGLELMSDVLLNANFPEAEFDRIKKLNASALLSAKSSADEMANNAVQKANFPKGHPYGEVMTEATLEAISKTDVENYYKMIFTPQGSYLVIVGDMNKEQAKEMVEKYFGTWKGGAAYKQEVGPGIFSKGNRVIFVKKTGAVQSKVVITYPIKIKQGDKDQIPLTVANGILGGGGFGTRMMQNLREDKAYTYGCYSSLDITNNGSYFSVSGNFRNDVTDSAIVQILKELGNITDSYVKDSELDLTKSVMAGNFARSLENPQTVARFALNIVRYNLPSDYYQTYLQKLGNISKEDVLDMTQSYFTAQNCNIIVVGNEDILEKLKVFDADGKIELFDAFGNEVKEMKTAAITKQQLIEKYILATTVSTSMKAANKKLKKVKSIKQVMEMSNAQLPSPLVLTTYFVAPNKTASKMEMQGMMIQKDYFDGSKGSSSNMQTGKKDFTEEEIAERKKKGGVFAELNYEANQVDYSLLGIEEMDGKDVYVLKVVDGESQSFDYYDVNTFNKVKSLNIQKAEGESVEVVRTFGDFKEVNGILFPHSSTLMLGNMGLDGKLTTIEINGKVEATVFQ